MVFPHFDFPYKPFITCVKLAVILMSLFLNMYFVICRLQDTREKGHTMVMMMHHLLMKLRRRDRDSHH